MSLDFLMNILTPIKMGTNAVIPIKIWNPRCSKALILANLYKQKKSQEASFFIRRVSPFSHRVFLSRIPTMNHPTNKV
ncbi:MAG: hypothetical protein ACI9AV_002555 [Sediminicola sp.]|jgi:hypothetical protein